MSEKVLFEFRAEEDEDGYTFVVKHDKEAIPAWCPAIKNRSFPSLKEGAMKRFRKYRTLSKRRMRRRLNFFERMYEELYGPREKSEE
ncbi:MAG: hypothetical protein A2Z14_15485 [Chloroflexi bacterium RBG_16_48_8]|nr:MAG: hypothetical protein A2Z14_15485 [Chloroflexi bacterium RBG_16_48_8]